MCKGLGQLQWAAALNAVSQRAIRCKTDLKLLCRRLGKLSVCDGKGTLGLWGEGNCPFSRDWLLAFCAGAPGRSFMQIQPTTGWQSWHHAKSKRSIHLSWLLRWSSNSRSNTGRAKNVTLTWFHRPWPFFFPLTFSDFSIFLLMKLKSVHIWQTPSRMTRRQWQEWMPRIPRRFLNHCQQYKWHLM